MASPANRRSKRGARISIDQYNAEKRDLHLEHELRIAKRKIVKLRKRFDRGLMRTPGKRIVRDGTQVVKTTSVPRHQGYSAESERYKKALAHLDYLQKEMKK